MDIDRLIHEKAHTLETWVPFHDFEIAVRYIDRPALQRMVESSKQRTFDRRTHQPREVVSDERLGKGLAALITGWRGLTLGKLARILPIAVDPGEADTAVPFSEKNAATLVREAYGLDNLLIDTVTDLQAFREERQEAEVKNSPASQGNT